MANRIEGVLKGLGAGRKAKKAQAAEKTWETAVVAPVSPTAAEDAAILNYLRSTPTSTEAATKAGTAAATAAEAAAKKSRLSIPSTKRGKIGAAAALTLGPTVGVPLTIMGAKGVLGAGANLWKNALGIDSTAAEDTTTPQPLTIDQQIAQLRAAMEPYNQAEAERLRQLYAQPEALLQLAGMLTGGKAPAGSGGTSASAGAANPYAAAAREAAAAQGYIGTPAGALTPAGPEAAGQVEDLRRAGTVYADRLAYIERAAKAAGVKVNDAMRQQIFQSILADEANRRNEVEAQIAARDVQTNDMFRQLALQNIANQQALQNQAYQLWVAGGKAEDYQDIYNRLAAQPQTKG